MNYKEEYKKLKKEMFLMRFKREKHGKMYFCSKSSALLLLASTLVLCHAQAAPDASIFGLGTQANPIFALSPATTMRRRSSVRYCCAKCCNSWAVTVFNSAKWRSKYSG